MIMAIYRIKERRVDRTEYDASNYWMEMDPHQRAIAAREDFDSLNALRDDEDPNSPAESTNPWRRSRLLWLLALLAILSFGFWSMRDYIFGDNTVFPQLARSNQLSQDESVSALKKAVVTIECSGSSGTGFNISPDGLIVTNAHVVDGGGYITLFFPEGRQRVYVGGEVTFLEGVDLALVDIDGTDLPCVELADYLPEAGQSVIFIGNPLGYDWTVSEGTVSGEAYVDGISVICISGPVRPGSSGSPVFDTSSQVIGVVFAMLTQKEDVGLVIPISYINQYINE